MLPSELWLAAPDSGNWGRMLGCYAVAVKRHCRSLKGSCKAHGRTLMKLDAFIWNRLVPKLDGMETPFLTKKELYLVWEYRVLRDNVSTKSLTSAVRLDPTTVEKITQLAFDRLRSIMSLYADGLETSEDNLKELTQTIYLLAESTQHPEASDTLRGVHRSLALSILSVVDPGIPFFDDTLFVAVASEKTAKPKPKPMSKYTVKELMQVVRRLREKASELGWSVRQVAKALWTCQVLHDLPQPAAGEHVIGLGIDMGGGGSSSRDPSEFSDLVEDLAAAGPDGGEDADASDGSAAADATTHRSKKRRLE
ncbi:hypothetical protein HDU96_007611 [Phlyctochytrium bullatum]|nr:hypothetical protein HDU96_007611 [Phlyctochytrium bullatum]